MNVPAERTGKSTGDLFPLVPAAGTFADRRADAGVISRRTNGSTGPGPEKRRESSGGGSKRDGRMGNVGYQLFGSSGILLAGIGENQCLVSPGVKANFLRF